MAELLNVGKYVHSADGDRYDLVGRRVSALCLEERNEVVRPDGSRARKLVPVVKCGVAIAHRYKEPPSTSLKPLYWVRFDDGTEENEIHSKFIGPEK
jgi:hypothetical protein